MQTRHKGEGVNLDAIRAELARRGVMTTTVTKEEREEKQEELKRCIIDPAYWISNYVFTYDPRLAEPFIKFKLFPRQEEMVHWLELRQDTRSSGCVEKSRDVGATWIISAFLLHRWLWYEGFAGGVGSRKLEYVDNIGDPKSIFEKLRMILRKLPNWMMPYGFEWKKHSLEGRLINPAMQSSIIGEGGAQIGRGGRTSMYVVDEFNYLEKPDLAEAALRDNTNVVIYVGTPNGLVGIAEKRKTLPLFTFHWKDDPRKNTWKREDGLTGQGPGAPVGAIYPWYEEQKIAHRGSEWILAQEIDIDYLGAGHPRFDRTYLAEIQQEQPAPLYEEMPWNSSWSATVKTWKEAKHGRRYAIFVDVAEGESEPKGDPDYSVAHVYCLTDWEQVCTYRGRPDTHTFAVDLAALGELYGGADIVIERTGPGLSTLKTLTDEIAYPSVWHTVRSDESAVAGVISGAKFKQESEAELDGIINDMKQGFPGFVWNDPNTIDEMLHFSIKPNGKASAEAGYHDDEVTCCKLASIYLPQMMNRKITSIPHDPPKPKVCYGQVTRRR